MRLAPLIVAVAGLAVFAGCPERAAEAPGAEDATTRPPTPSPAPTSLAGPGEVVFVYSAGGDVYAETVEGGRAVLASGPDDEVWPSLSGDGSELLYQVGSGPPGEIVHLDLSTGVRSSLGAGQYPSFGPDGRAAWVVDNATDAPLVVVGRPFSEPEAEIVPIAEWDGPILVAPPLSWDGRGHYLYYSAGWEETSGLYQTDSRGDANPFPLLEEMGLTSTGVHLLGPHVEARASVTVFRACCMESVEDPWEDFDLGRVRFTEAGGDYEEVVDLDLTRFDQSFPGWYPQVLGLGRWWRDADTGRWSRADERSWIVGNAAELWLLSEGGRAQNLGDDLIARYGYPRRDAAGVPATFAGWGQGTL